MCQVVKSQVEVVLKEEEKVFARAGQVEKGFGEEVAYKVIRERMLREVEEKDDLMGKAPIRLALGRNRAEGETRLARV